MRVVLALLIGAASLISAIPADARDGCGRGWYFDGNACRPQGGGYGGPGGYGPGYGSGPGYGPEYGPPRSSGYGARPSGYDQPIYQQDSFGNPEIWYQPYSDQYGRPMCRQHRYTVQDGYCKPYRGY
jgi:hypothetical protein